ncbi:MAG: FecR domain-containing protein [bacterium]|nr:FecR domain-containing protein [bacterium]
MSEISNDRHGADTALELLRLVGPRRDPPEASAERVRSSVRSHWKARTASRRKSRWLAAAAAILAGAMLTSVWVVQRQWAPVEPFVVATVALQHGDVTWAVDDNRLSLGTYAEVFNGTTIETGYDGRAAVHLSDGQSLRVDNSSRVLFEADGRVRLEQGAMYVDSQVDTPDGGIVVATPFGEVLEIGTQFEVRLVADGMRVRVREGLVRTAHAAGTHEVKAGSEMMLGGDGEVNIYPLLPTHQSWNWILDAAPSFTLDGSSAAALVKWACREIGYGLEWATPELAKDAARITLHGDISDVRPDEVLDLVLPICSLEHQIENGSVVVRTMAH